MKIYAYKNGSASARALRDALGIKLLKHEGKQINQDVVINWGSSRIERNLGLSMVLNPDHAVKNASNKLTTFKLFTQAGVACPDWSEDDDDAIKWLAEGFDVVSRTVLNGHSGDGIVINKALSGQYELAPLYTKYVKKQEEYRIHVAGGDVIFEQRKARKKDVPDDEVNWQVRNLAGGFIFANDGVRSPDCCRTTAIEAVKALGLDFGAVDIVTNKKDQCFALEVNTACGLAGKTIDAYVKFFQQYR